MKAYLISAAISVFTAVGANATCLDTVKDRGVLTAGTGVMGLKPYVWMGGASEKYSGLEADILSAVAKRVGIAKSSFVVSDWTSLIPGLKAERWDVVLSTMFVTQERIQGAQIDFTDPYFKLYKVIVVTKDSPVNTLEDLKGKPVASVLGTYDSISAHELEKAGKVSQVLDFNGFGEPFQALRSGQVAAVVLDHASFRLQEKELGDLRVIGQEEYKPKEEWAAAEAKAPYVFGSMAMGVRSECSDLKVAINSALAEMDADGTRKRILESYGLWDSGQAVLKK